MDPITIALLIVGAATSLIGGVVGGASALLQGRATAQAQLDAAALSRQNAATQEFNARRAEQLAEQKRRDSLRRSRALFGSQEAQLGALGVAPGGSAEDILSDTFSQGLEEEFRIKKEGELQKFDFLSQADRERFQASALTKQAKTTRSVSLLTATGSLLGGIAGAASIASGIQFPTKSPKLPPPFPDALK